VTRGETLRERGAARMRARSEALLEEAAERSRPRTVVERLRANWRWFAQAALATAPSWALAQELFGHERPIFAPLAGLIAVSTTLGRRRRYAVEMVLGVALGIGIADALFTLIGSGTWQIAAIVVGAMVAAVALGGSAVLVSEAAVSALLVVAVQPPGTGLSGARFLDSLLGGVIGLVVTSVLPANPARTAHRAAAWLLAEIAATIEEAALALERRDPEPAERAWTRASEIDPDVLGEAVAAGNETLRLAPWLRGTRAQFARYAHAAMQIDNAAASVEALSRGAVRAIAQGDNVPAPVPEALRELADAVRRLEGTLDEGGDETAVREPALRAAARATLVLEQTHNLSVSLIVVQVRSLAVDLLRGSGLDRDEAERLVREAARTLA
jgi:Fusaric acid resistance protein-like